MPTITTGGSGNWSSVTPNAPWPGGTLPTSADDVVIANTHTVSLDVTTAVANTLTVNSGGTFQKHATNSGKIVINGGLTMNGTMSFDMSGSVSQKAEIYLSEVTNGSVLNVADGTTLKLKGFHKKRWSKLSAGIAVGATSCSVVDTTGWQVGDDIKIGPSQGYVRLVTWPMDERTTAGSVTAWASGTTYAHAAGSAIANLSSNLIFGTTAYGKRALLQVNDTSSAGYRDVTDVRFQFAAFKNNGSNYGFYDHTLASPWDGKELSHNIFYRYQYETLWFYNICLPVTKQFNVATCTLAEGLPNVLRGEGYVGPWDDHLVLGGGAGIGFMSPGTVFNRPNVSCTDNYEVSNSNVGVVINDGSFYCAQQLYNGAGSVEFNNCDIGTFGPLVGLIAIQGYAGITVKGGTIQSGAVLSSLKAASIGTEIRIENKNADVTAQESYVVTGTALRDNSTATRSPSAVSLQPGSMGITSTTQTFSSDFPVASGEAAVVVGYCQFDTAFYNANDYTAPQVTIIDTSGTVLATYTATAAANGAWEKFTLSPAAPASDTNYTVNLIAADKTVHTGKVFFSGVPVSPWVTRARHYGYVLDQTTPKASLNITASAAEATAVAYTGMTVAWGASQSNVTITADNTFQKLYDYTQAQSCLNLASAIPLTGAGVAGNPTLFAAGNVTINTGFKLNSNGVISMGAFTLSSEFSGAVAYTYTGGAWSQLTTVPAFSGGTVNIGAAGTFVFTMSSAVISLTPTAPSTYNLGGCTFSGTIYLKNTTANAITVQVPAGATTDTSLNTGGAITVASAPVVLTLTGLISGSDIVVLNAGTSTPQVNVNANAGTTYAFNYTYSAGDYVDIGVFMAGYVPFFIRNYLLAATSGSLPISQVVDRNYS